MILFFLEYKKNNMPAKGTKLSSSALARRRAKAALRTSAQKAATAAKRAATLANKGPRSSAQKAAAVNKARLTRCVNQCNATGGVRQKKRSMSDSKKIAAKARLAPWQAFLATWRANNPDVKGKNVMILASVDYKAAKAALA